jgi:pimeloyl-ACP methyl ester carboxylesterase
MAAMPELEGVSHSYPTVRGLRMHVAEAGEGEPLVLLHGWPQHWWMWRNQIGPLARAGYRVICPDLRGHGWSDKPRASYRKDELMLDVLALLDELGIERVRFAGHDWGGYVGMLAGLAHPERLEKLAILSIPHPWQRKRFAPRRALTLWYQFVLAAPILGPLAVARLGFPELILRRDGRLSDEEVAVYSAVLREPDATDASVRMYRHFLLHDLARFLGGELHQARLSAPTLWLIGENDPVAGGADDGYRDFADRITFERVPDTGHFLPEQRPGLVTERLLEFFA